MKNLSCVLLLLGGLALPYILPAQNSLTVLNPQKQWQKAYGTIESATFSVHPKGLYMECGLYLTFSAAGTESVFSDDSLEVIYNFTLPKGSIIHDSWLWIGNDIARAKILDRWTASQIYEGTVKRRADPSLLVKNSETSYELRVYPLKKGQTRRVKITYLLPVEWGKKDVKINIPGELIAPSFKPVSQFNLLVFPAPAWDAPSLTGAPGLALQEITDPQSGEKNYQAALPPAQYTLKPSLSYPTPLKDGVFVAAHGDSEGGIYQLAVLPSAFLKEPRIVKLALLFNYEAEVLGVPFQTAVEKTRQYLKSTLRATDSFNLFLPGLTIQQYSPTWVPGNEAAIDQALDALSGAAVGYYSQLPAMFSKGIQYLKQNNGGQLMLLSNTAGFSNLDASNSLITDVLAAMAPDKFPIHVLNFRMSAIPYFLAGNTYFYGNNYLYHILTQQTGGTNTYILDWQSDVDQTFSTAFGNLWVKIESFEMSTGMTDGLCYGRFNLKSANTLYTILNQPILQVGKFKGEFPFKITLSGELDGQLVYETREIPAADIHTADTLNREMWYGNFIRLFESQSPTTTEISEIIFNSLQERVLSRYTAFLCIEDPATYCSDCVDETNSVGTDAVAADSSLLAFPNPFTDFVTIQAAAGALSRSETATMEVYDLSGRLVRVLTPAWQGERLTGIWRGDDTSGAPAAAGVYVVLVQSGSFSGVVRVAKGAL